MGITFDGATKRIIATSGTTTLDVRDVYSRWKDWVAADDNARWAGAFRVVGGDPIGGVNSVAPYFFLLNGWRLRPQEANHSLVITGALLVDGGGDPVVPTLGSYRVLVQHSVPVRAEAVATGGGGGGGATPSQIADAVWAHAAAAVLQGEVGELLGLAGKNQVIDQVTSDASGIATARLRTFPTAEDAVAGTNASGAYQLLLSRAGGLLSMVRMVAS